MQLIIALPVYKTIILFKNQINFNERKGNILVEIINKFKTLSSNESIKAKVAQGGVWIGSANMLEQGLRFCRNVLLARILLPEDFGLMAIVLAFSTFFESFTEVGVKQSIIHNQYVDKYSYLNCAWWFSFTRSLMLYLIVFVSAPCIADFYSEPQLTTLLRVSFLGIVFKGAMSSRAYVTLKKMQFKQWVIINEIGSFFGIISAVILAFILQNVWALVIGFTLEWAARLILSFIVVPILPSLKFEKDHLWALLKYARGMLGLPILTFVFMRTDIFVLGKIVSKSDLGLYSMAAALAYIPLRLMTKILSDTVMPAFSQMQNNNEKLNQALLKITKIISLLSLPMLMFAILYREDILHMTYGFKYVKVAVPFAIIFATSVIRLSSMPIAGLYLAIGKPHLHRFFTGLRAIIIVILIYPFIKYFGMTGAAVAGFISMVIGFIFQVLRLRLIIKFNINKYVYIFIKAIAFSCIVLIVWIIIHSFLKFAPIVNISIALPVSLFTYGLVLMILVKSNGSLSKLLSKL